MIVAICLVILATFLFLFLNWYNSVNGRLYRDSRIPSPPEVGVLGHARAVVPMWSDEGAHYLDKWSLTYPKVWKLRLGPFVELVTSDAQVIKQVFAGKAEKNHNYTYGIKWLGDGLLFSRGSKWFMRRRLLTPSFHFDILKTYIQIFNETTAILIGKLRNLNGKPVEVFPQALAMSLDTILRCLLSYETNCQLEDDEYAKLMYRLTILITDRVYSPETAIDFIYNLTQKGREYNKLKARFLEITRGIIEGRRSKHKNNPDLLKDVDKLDFLDVLLTTKYEDGTSLTTGDVMEEANVFVFEGHDTTASGITWSLFLLACHRHHLQKCYEEIKELFDATKDQDYVTQAQINGLSHFGMCIKECLRMKPPVPYIGREVAQDIHLEHCTIPKGASIEIVIDSLHKQAEYWEDPLTFWPERFLPENSRNRDPYAYLPFSAGLRNCIGQTFAVTELKMAVAKVIYNFDLETVDKENVRRMCTLIQKPLNLYLKFLPRE